MKKQLPLFVAAFAAVLACSTSAFAQGSVVAVCDIQKVFDSLKEKLQIEAELNTQADLVKQEENKRRTKIKELDADLKILAPGTPAHEKKTEELERAVLDLQVWLNFQQSKLMRERAVRMENIYNKMVGTIGRVAQAGSAKVVLFKEPELRLSGGQFKPEQISAVIVSRKVIWASDDLDITDQVVQKMNNEFNSGAAPVPAPK